VDVVVDPRVAVAEDHRAVAQAQVDVFVAVHVPDPAALAAVDVHGVVAPGAEVRVGTARHRLLGTLVELGLATAAKRRRGLGHGTSSAPWRRISERGRMPLGRRIVPRPRVGRQSEIRSGTRDSVRIARNQTGVATQFGSSRARVARGMEPCPRAWSWNSRRSNAAPSRAAISRLRRAISRWPVLYVRACAGQAM